jgi:hypothetical protein
MRQTIAADLQDLVRLDGPGFYADNPYPVFERLQHRFPTWHPAGQVKRVLSAHVSQDARVPAIVARSSSWPGTGSEY